MYKRILAFMLMLCLTFGQVQEVRAVSENNTVVESTEKTDRQNNSSQETERVKNEKTDVSAEANHSQLNYLYIANSTVETPNEQNVVLSWGDGTEQISDMKIRFCNEDGEVQEWCVNKKVDNLFLFTKEFIAEEAGIYRFDSLSFIEEGENKSYSAQELEINAFFGVDQVYQGTEKTEHIEMTSLTEEEQNVETSVVSLNSGNIEYAGENIETAFKTAYPRAKFSSEKSGDLVIVLDPGHDVTEHTGARGNGVKEEEATLKIAQYCKQELEQYAGVRVYMTRTNGNCPFPNSTSNIDDIKKRVAWAKSVGAGAFISFHLNSSGSSAANGAEVYYYEGNVQGENLASKIQQELVALGLGNRGIKEDTEYAVINSSQAAGFPGLIIEHAFLSNASDANNYLKTESGLKKLGTADAKGIAKAFNLSKGRWEKAPDGRWRWNLGNGTYAKNMWIFENNLYYWVDSEGYMVTGFYNISGETYYFNSSGVMQIGWLQIDGNWYRFRDSGAMAVGWLSLGGNWYFFDENGIMQTNWVQLNGNWYYFDASGVMASGIKTIDSKKYYFDTSGCMRKNYWYTTSGKKYYFGSDGVAMTAGFHEIDGIKYLFGNDGALAKGWVKVGNEYYYVRINGNIARGWLQLEGNWYYFDTDGVMQTGWHDLGGSRYWLDASGVMATGLKTIAGEKYFFNTSGHMQKNCWQTVKGEKYYFGSTGKALHSGWHTINNKAYLFGDDGRVAKGWTKVGSNYYYGRMDGSVAKYWLQLEGNWYYFGSDGVMKTGWHDLSGSRYWFDASGVMATGLKTIAGEKYFFNTSGYMQKNCWQTVKDQKYYFGSTGKALHSGWHTINNKAYLFGDDGRVAKGWTKVGSNYYYGRMDGSVAKYWLQLEGNWYYFGSDGVMQTGWHDLGGSRYWLDASGVMATGLKKIEGSTYYFNISGHLQKKCWQVVNGDTYYFGEDGKMQTGWLYIGENYYYLGKDGKMTTGWQNVNGYWYYLHVPGGDMATGCLQLGENWYYLHVPGGNMAIGWQKINGTWYYFKASGAWVENPSSFPPAEGKTLIEGKEHTTVTQMVEFYESSGKKYPKYYKTTEASTIEKFCKIYIEEANKQGIRADVAFAQAMYETGYLQFGNDVKIEQFNFAGIGAVGGGAAGASFPDVRTGIRAQIQHLHAYATKEGSELVEGCVDPRYKYVQRGSSPYVEWLGIPDNPYGVGWAATAGYGTKIKNMANKMNNM